MGLTEKFTFDLDFDEENARLMRERQVKRDEEKQRQEEQEREAVKQRFTPEQIEEIKNQAREEGKRLGLEEAKQSQEKAMLDTLSRVVEKANVLSTQEKERELICQRTGIETAFSLLKKISPSLTKGKELDDVNALIAQAFDENPNEQRLVIRVHDSILDTIVKNIDKMAAENGFAGKPIVLADQSLSPQDCRIEWADGGLERITGSLWDGLEKAINHILVGLPAKPKKVKKETEEVIEEDKGAEEQSVKTETEDAPIDQTKSVSEDNDTEKKEEVSDE